MKMKTKSLAIILIFFKFIINSDERLVVTGADEPVYAHAGEDVTLSCSVDTHVNVTKLQVEWRKTDDDGDIMVLLYAHGENRPGSQHERYSGRAEFFTEEIPKGNFSMKLRKVRLEDKGDFICKVHSDTDSNSTTARIAAVGYSSLHWLILGLCITVIPVVLLTGALSVWYYKKESEGRQALLSHWSFVAVPSVMVSSAFLLWGVTEGSTEEAVTCTVITLLNILMLFNMDAKQLYPGTQLRTMFLIQTLGSTIIITAVCTGSVVRFWTKNSASQAGKVILGVFIGEFVLMMIFLASVQFILYWFKIQTLKKTLWAASVFLIIFFSVAVGVGVFLANQFSGRADIGPFLTVFIVPMIVFLIPIVGFGILLIHSLRKGVGFYRFLRLFHNLNMMLYIQIILTLYIQLFTWMQGTVLMGYFIPIIVTPLGICACFIAKIFLQSFRHFYLVQKILSGILFPLHLILSLQYIRLILDNDKERPVKICEFVFIYILIVTNNDDWKRKQHLAKPRKYVYFSGAFALPLLNSAALAVALMLKADTGKEPLDLWLIVLISGSVFLFSWFVVQMSAYYLFKKGKIKEAFGHLQRLQDVDLDQPELIQERLELLLHAERCQWEEHDSSWWSCSRPHCHTMRMVLKHMTECQDSKSCQVKHCASSRWIMSQWKEGYIWSYKPELIQERLELLKHSDSCQWEKKYYGESWSCSRPHCATMKEVLEHMTECQARESCQVKHCASSRRIILENKDYEWRYIPELIQERLELLKHSDSCQWEKQKHSRCSCSRPHCRTMRKVLKHMTECQAGPSCQMKHCASSRRIILENKDYEWRYIGSLANEETVASSPPDPNGPNTEEGSYDNLEMEPLSPADHNEPNTEGSHDDQEMEPLSPADHNEPNTEVTEESSTGI